MLRVTGGYLGGRRVASPAGPVRPTQERVREALFSMLAARMAGCRFLDLYAGSGIVGLEAWSRGAGTVTLVERDRSACERIRRQVAAFGGADQFLGAARVIQDGTARFLRRLAAGPGAEYDLVFADPPYADDGGATVDRLSAALIEARLPAPGGLWIMETRARPGLAAAGPPAWRALADRVYGETRLTVYQRTDKDDEAGDLCGNV